MNTAISTLRVTRFRGLRDLTVGPFGRVNLITGRNNAGKSSLLEAIRILATDGAPSTFHGILNYREESVGTSAEPGSILTPNDSTSFSSLFSGFPTLGGCEDPFTISSEGVAGAFARSISVRVGWYSEQFDSTEGRRFVKAEPDFFGEPTVIPMIEIKTPSRNRLMRIDSSTGFRRSLAEGADGNQYPCIYLDPFSSRSTNQLAAFWDAIALKEEEKQVVNALRIISPDIEAVSMVGGDPGSRSRRAIAKSRAHPNPIPLRTFGDGVNRLFGIILSLSCAKGGILLVDEIENGLHHSILEKVWMAVFQMARTLNVQVFATTHSWDCIKAFQSAASADAEEGVLVRLSLREGNVIPTLIGEAQLRIASREQIELR